MPSSEDLHHLPNQVGRLRFIVTTDVSFWSNTFWVRLGGTTAPSVSDLTTWVDSAAMNAAVTALYAWMYNGYTVIKREVVFMSGGSLIETTVDDSTPGGHAVTSLLPLNTAALISWKTAEFYKGGHPRTYIAGIDDTFTTGARQLTSTGIAHFASAGAGFRAQVNGSSIGSDDFELGVARFSADHVALDPAVFHPFTRDPTAQARLCTQRRRLGTTSP